MPNYLGDFRQNPSCQLVQTRCSPWNYSDKILLMGDAAHAIVPFYGQGMNAGMEDVLAFSEVLDKFKNNLSKSIPYFARERKPTGDAIGDLSLHNYVEMRDHTASSMFLFKKKIEGLFNWLMPNTWVPLYKMVAFTRIPYHHAIERGNKQEKTLDNILFGATCVGVAGMALGIMYGSGVNDLNQLKEKLF